MPVYIDDDGNEFNLNKSIEEIQKENEDNAKALEDTNKNFEDYKKEKEGEITEINEKLSKLENKDFNFKSLRDLTEEQQAKLTNTERALMEQAEKHEKELKDIKEGLVGDAKTEILNKLTNGNEEVNKKVLEAYDTLNLKESSKAEIEAKMRAAYKLAVGGDNDGSSSYSSTGDAPIPEKVSEIKPEVKKLGANLGLTEEDFKKYSK